MLKLKNNKFLIETPADLPNLQNAKELFLDVETKRVFDHPKHGGYYPWKGDRICGVSVSVEDKPEVFYIPVRHTNQKWNIPLDKFQQWLKDIVGSCQELINHSIVFDAMFCSFDGAEFSNRLICVKTYAKLHDSDRINHELKPMCRDWLGFDISASDRVSAYLEGIKSKNFADVPADIMGDYGTDDVVMTRKLYRFLQANIPADLSRVWENEAKLTPVLYDMEKEGLQIDPIQCKKESVKCLTVMINEGTKIQQIVDREFTNSNDCIFDILINQCGYPILATKKERKKGQIIDTGRPTFDEDALLIYQAHPLTTATPKFKELLDSIIKYRDASQKNGLFLNPFLELCDDEYKVHTTYNQIVRTGRMSAKRPNSQQQNKWSKALIHPEKGLGFISNDYSQIEFRLIIHYIKDEAAIKAYCENPNTDFHQWVADMIGVVRKRAKTLNFGMAYGQGKKGVVGRLASDPSIIEEIGGHINKEIELGHIAESQRHAAFIAECVTRSEESYNAYHEKFPGIKSTSREAMEVAKFRGYVFNAYGRRRHLPPDQCHKAFNAIIQGLAMDVMKEAMIKLSPRYNDESKKIGLTIGANVHDELLNKVPLESLYEQSTWKFIKLNMENPSVKFRIPIVTEMGISANSWAEANNDKNAILPDGKPAGRVHLP